MYWARVKSKLWVKKKRTFRFLFSWFRFSKNVLHLLYSCKSSAAQWNQTCMKWNIHFVSIKSKFWPDMAKKKFSREQSCHFYFPNFCLYFTSVFHVLNFFYFCTICSLKKLNMHEIDFFKNLKMLTFELKMFTLFNVALFLGFYLKVSTFIMKFDLIWSKKRDPNTFILSM